MSDILCKYYLVPYLKLFNTLYPAIKVNVICPTTPGIIKLLKTGRIDFGIACVIRNFIEDELDRGSLHEIRLIEKIPPRHVSAAWLKNVPLSAAAKELISHLDYNEVTEI